MSPSLTVMIAIKKQASFDMGQGEAVASGSLDSDKASCNFSSMASNAKAIFYIIELVGKYIKQGLT